MNLLRAARGPIIDDLQVDWGVPEISEQTKDEEFEMVAADGPAPPPVAPPANIDLFDTSNTANTAPELGPKDQPIILPLPPRIQQAPKTEKLPIPLYPGFRCSIFAIIKQSSPNAPFSSSVRIHGQVLGSPVSLEIPVQPVATEVAHISDENVHLLHTLAARALIQDWEDKEMTDVIRAEIVRLGRRYSLASSATSFVAVETDTHFSERKEVEVNSQEADKALQDIQQLIQNIGNIATRGERLDALDMQTEALSISAQSFRKSKSKSSGWASSLKMPSGPSNVIQSFFQSLVPRSSSSSSAPPPPVMASAISPGPSTATSAAISFAPQKRALEEVEKEEELCALSLGMEGGQLSSISAGSLSPPGAGASPRLSPLATQPSAGPPTSALSVEWIARNQKFDGGFPTTSDFHSVLLGSATLPALPSVLVTCSGPKEVKDSVWVTLLTLAVLEKRYASEKDAWELLAEKSIQFVETALAGALATGNVRVGELIAGLRGEAAKHV
jgi:hypothetical protein